MKITIDCRHIDSSGIGVYLKECLPFFLESDNYFYLLGNPKRLTSFLINDKNNAEILKCNIKPFSLSELLFFPFKLLKKINCGDLFYSPSFNIPAGIKVPVLTTIHDIIFPDMPELVSRIGLKTRMFFFNRCFNRSKKIFTVSEFSKSRIEHYSKKKQPIIVTYSAIQQHIIGFKSESENIQKKDFILFIGNIKKHKGLNCLLEAFLMAKDSGLKQKLVIAGNACGFRSFDKNILNKLSAFNSDEIEVKGYLPDEKVLQLLTEASLLVQPSLYEGFGLPPLEALYCGTPALISDIPVFREIYSGFPVTFFKAGDPIDLKEKLLSILYNKKPQKIVLSDELYHKYNFKRTSQIVLGEFQ